MTQDEIIRSPLGREQLVALAREAGLFNQHNEDLLQDKEVMAQFERFAALVAAHEREKLKTPRMTLDEIKKLGGHRPMTPWVVSVVIEAMAIEREACAKVCAEGWKEGLGAKYQGDVFAEAIRARGEK